MHLDDDHVGGEPAHERQVRRIQGSVLTQHAQEGPAAGQVYETLHAAADNVDVDEAAGAGGDAPPNEYEGGRSGRGGLPEGARGSVNRDDGPV